MSAIALSTLPIQDALEQLRLEPRSEILQKTLGKDAQLHLVGGAIRNIFLNLKAVDLDYCCKLPPEEITSRLEQKKITAISTGKQFLTITAIPHPDLRPVEISTFRGPNLSPQNRNSYSTSIEEDLLYRDFTINSFALPLVGSSLHFAEHALEDVNQRIIRAIGNPTLRFTEDPLRLLRMVRFACGKDFSIENETLSQALTLRRMLSQVSTERIRDEFSKILLSENPDRGLQLILKLEFIDSIIPELKACVNFEQNRYHRADLLTHTLEVVRSTSPELRLRLAALLHDIGKPQTLSIDPETKERHFYKHEVVGALDAEHILSRLKYPRQLIQDVVTLVQTHMRPIEAGASGLRRLLRDTDTLFPLWRELKIKDTLACKIDEKDFNERLSRFDEEIEKIKQGPELSPLSSLAINGNDLLALGMKPSPEIGKILRALHEMVLDNPELNEKEALLSIVHNRLKITPE